MKRDIILLSAKKLLIGSIFFWISLLLLLTAKPALCQNKEMAEKYFNEAGECFDKHQYKETISLYHKAIENDPNDSGSYINIAVIYFTLGQRENAISNLEMAEKLGPGGTSFKPSAKVGLDEKSILGTFYLLIGSIYRKAGEYQRAIQVLKKSIEANGKAFIPYFQLAGSYFESGMYNDAINYYAKAIEINPNSGDSYFLLATSQEKVGRHAEAIDNLKKAADAYQKNNEKEKFKTAEDALRRVGAK